jgi:hypothetical protein
MRTFIALTLLTLLSNLALAANPQLGFNELAANQAQPHITINTADRSLSSAIAGQVTINAASDANITMLSNQWQYATIVLTDSGVVLTTGRDLIYPNVDAQTGGVSRMRFLFRNSTTQTITVKRSGHAGVAVPAGSASLLQHNGTDIEEISSGGGGGGLTSPVGAVDGGTGQTSYTKGDLLCASGASTLTKLGVGADDDVLTADAGETCGVKWAAGGGGGGVEEAPIDGNTYARQNGAWVALGATTGWVNVNAWAGSGTSTGWAGYTMRIVYPDIIVGQGSKVRITVRAPPGSALTFNEIWVGQASNSGDAYDFASTPQQLLFSASSSPQTIAANQFLVSDEITLTTALDGISNLIFSVYFPSTPAATLVTGSGGPPNSYYKNASDASTEDATGYSTQAGTIFIQKLEVFRP